MLTSLLSLGLVSLLTTTTTGAPITSSSLAVRDGSNKKGVAYENPNFVPLFGDKVSWCYNWVSGSKFSQSPNIEFVPMLHSDEQIWTSVWEAEFKTSYDNGARHVLSFNEPDQCGGGGVCMQSVSRTVDSHRRYIDAIIGPKSDVKIGAPAVTNGVQDPVTGATMGVGFLKEFLAGCSGCRIDFLVAHWYGPANLQNFLDHIQAVYEAGGSKLPVWVTEFAPEGDEETKKNFLREAVEKLDGLDYVERYAYHYATQGVLVDASGSGLSALGSTYVS